MSFAHLTGCRLSAQPQLYEEYMCFLAALGRGSHQAAESCHLLLERVATSVKSLSPAYMLAHELPLIVPFVRQRLEQLDYLANRGLSVQVCLLWPLILTVLWPLILTVLWPLYSYFTMASILTLLWPLILLLYHGPYTLT